MKTLVIAIALCLAGCASLEKMTPEQIEAAAKAKDANVFCATADTLTVDANVLRLNVDKGVVLGEMEVKCGPHSVRITNGGAK